MLIEIDDTYIEWVKKHQSPSDSFSDEDVVEYVNEVLEKHRQSWEDLDEDLTLIEYQ